MRIRDKNVPCFGCNNREFDCHSKCPDYMEYFISNQEQNENKLKETEFFDYKKKIIDKAVKKKRHSLINK